MGAVEWLATVAGTVLVLVVLHDLFATVLRPNGRGGLSRWVMRAGWRAGLALPRFRGLAGPLTLVVSVSCWLVLLVVGAALVYWPHLTTGFSYVSAVDPASRSDLLDAVYVSAVVLATLGFGDVLPSDAWLRLVVPVQALIGFGLITAAVTWILQVSPALTRRRAFAVRLSLLRRVDTPGLVHRSGTTLGPQLLQDLALGLVELRVDVTQHAEMYWFLEHDPDASLPTMLGVALAVAEEAVAAPDPDVRWAGALLAAAAGDYLQVVDAEFLHVGGSDRELAAANAAAHGQQLAGLT
ncbi:potassium channel family protein [Klenkia sp. LSe6-5]|uniref:Potassium channel family protein n=1 Tax=Klenkia sesuvii TaxID=3103137 RepID=A0ABU8DSD2_9ACTN